MQNDQNREIDRFDIFIVAGDPHAGPAQPGGSRPWLIVSSGAANKKKNIVSVAPITSNTATVGESGVLIQIDGRDSAVLLDHITTIDKKRLGKFLGKLGNEKALAVATALNEHFIPENFTPEPLKHKFVKNAAVPFEEDRRYELKEITSARPANVIKNVADEYAVAFLNSEGGRIFWGIRDSDRVVVGVKLTPAERDEVRKEVASKLAGIQPQIDLVRLRLTFHEIFDNDAVVADLFVAELSVPRGEPATMHFTSGDKAYVRLDGVNQKLKGPQIQQWILGRAKAAGDATPIAAAPQPSSAQRKQEEILVWKGKLVTLSIMNTGQAVMLVGPVAGTSAVMIVDCTEFYVTISMNGSERSISLSNVDISFDSNHHRLDLQERYG